MKRAERRYVADSRKRHPASSWQSLPLPGFPHPVLHAAAGDREFWLHRPLKRAIKAEKCCIPIDFSRSPLLLAKHPLVGGVIIVGVQPGADRIALRDLGGLGGHEHGQAGAQLWVDVGPAGALQEVCGGRLEVVGGDVVAVGDGGAVDELAVVEAGETRASGAVGVIADRSDDRGELPTCVAYTRHRSIVAMTPLILT